MADLHGVIKYTIETDGCLIGIFTNTLGKDHSTIRPDMARKNPNTGAGLAGTYDSVFSVNKLRCQLLIEKDKKNEKVFHFKWFTKKEGPNNPFHMGIGMQIDDKTIIVSYWD